MNNEALKAELQVCLDTLRSGGTILYPTDTIWGIGCDATSVEAVNKIYRIKKRSADKSPIILLDSANKLPLYVESVPLITWDLLKNISTPLTIIYPKGKNLAHNILSADGSVAIRIVNHDFCREMIREFGKPVVSTSANLSGDGNPLSFQAINPAILSSVDHTVGLFHDIVSSMRPSRIIRLYDNGEFDVIRP